MASRPLGATIRRIERLFHLGSVAGLSEVQLLEQFVRQHDQAAFEALVERHGPMVMGVCRQWLRDPRDAEDAFQATFLVLVRKASSLRDCTLLGNWLYGVAYRVALRARSDAAKRRSRETGGVDNHADPSVPTSQEDRPWLYEEVNRLPEKYRAPIVLCYLEGRTHEEAAEQLCWPVGTVKGRLSRARDLLRARLIRRGIAPSVGAVTAAFARDASAALPVPVTLVDSTVQAASAFAAAKGAAAGPISAQVAALIEGVCHAMFLNKLKLIVTTIVVTGLLTASAGVIARARSDADGENRGQETTKKGEPNAPEKAKASAPQTTSGGIDPFDPAEMIAAPPKAAPRPPSPPFTKNAAAPRGGGGGFGGGGTVTVVSSEAGAMGGADDSANVEHKRRVLIAQTARRVAASDGNPRTKAILNKLDDPISMSFPNETPLEDVLKFIKSATTGANDAGISIYVDPIGLQEAEKTLTSTIMIDLEGVPLKTTLRLLLKQLGLAYCVKDGLLMISTPEGICQELEEAESEPNNLNVRRQ